MALPQLFSRFTRADWQAAARFCATVEPGDEQPELFSVGYVDVGRDSQGRAYVAANSMGPGGAGPQQYWRVLESDWPKGNVSSGSGALPVVVLLPGGKNVRVGDAPNPAEALRVAKAAGWKPQVPGGVRRAGDHWHVTATGRA